MNPPKKITITTASLDLNYFTNNPNPVPLGSAVSGTIDDQSTIITTSTVVDEENTSTDVITAMLAIYKFANRDKTTGQYVQILPADGTTNDVGVLLTNNPDEAIISITPVQHTFEMTVVLLGTENDYGGGYVSTYQTTAKWKFSQGFISLGDDTGKQQATEQKAKFNTFIRALTFNQLVGKEPIGDDKITQTTIEALKIVHSVQYSDSGATSYDETLNSNNTQYAEKAKPFYSDVSDATFTEDKTSIENPLKDFDWNDGFKLFTYPAHTHYIRFGALLGWLQKNVLIKIKSTGDPIFKIENQPWNTYMYSLPNQISLDPRVCIVRNDHIEVGFPDKQTQAFKPLQYFREFDIPDKSTFENSALPLNIYLNFDFVIECLKTDDKGNISVYQFISNICIGLNKALGGINNLEPVIDETINTLRIIDTTPIPYHSAADNGPGYMLQIYGYDNFISNFVRKVDLKTAITPEYATMITVGATAGGYVKGTEATAFSKWNTGLIDRFKEELLHPQGTSASSREDEADDNYADVFILHGYANRYGLNYLGEGMKFSDNIIEKNISVVTEYYRWLIAKQSIGNKPSGGTVGFIPFKLGLTLDGIAGIKIYNVLRINTEFLPKAYGKTVNLIITGVSHRLNNNDWETSIEATVMPKTGNTKLSVISVKEVRENINTNIQNIQDNTFKKVASFTNAAKNGAPNYNDGTMWAKVQRVKGWGYQMGGTVTKSKLADGKKHSIDCSGFISWVFGIPGGSWYQTENANNLVTSNTLNASTLKHGDIIGMDTGDAGHDGSDRKSGVDHIVGVVKDPLNNQLYLCESAGGGVGVRIQPIAEGVAYYNKYAKKKGFGTQYNDGGTMKTKQFYIGNYRPSN
jgi:hypothetical protein